MDSSVLCLACTVLHQAAYTRADLHWAGADHVYDFLLSQQRLRPLLLPGADPSAAAAAVAAAAAAVPQLVVPDSVALRRR
jgi:hypothetical protein